MLTHWSVTAEWSGSPQDRPLPFSLVGSDVHTVRIGTDNGKAGALEYARGVFWEDGVRIGNPVQTNILGEPI